MKNTKNKTTTGKNRLSKEKKTIKENNLPILRSPFRIPNHGILVRLACLVWQIVNLTEVSVALTAFKEA